MVKELIQKIKEYKNFLITSHINLEGDAIGSLLAMRALLTSLGKKATMVVSEKIPQEYNFVGDTHLIKRLDKIDYSKYDVLIVLDCSDQMRAEKIIEAFGKGKPIINIDHHISNTYFGDINWIEPEASSTAEMIYKLYEKLKVPLNRKIALWLYTGIFTDTGSFHYPNTTSASHRISSKLIDYGLKVHNIYRNIYQRKTISDVRFLIATISTINSTKDNKIIWFKMRKSLFNKYKPSSDLTEELLNFGRLIKDAEVVVLFKENSYSNTINVNLRSQGKIDVNKIASYFGGGGHRSASGCKIKGNLLDAERKVIAKIKQYL
ncbi:MAG: bifunctional oligoribonuclease/PAP phosphatase NrnA [Candidatus Omnitrophica bacterium]|nr:bifunctional oligoribonuclease/PAP phosphatase NrnA [Candidatus Omnitrophota bacterium]